MDFITTVSFPSEENPHLFYARKSLKNVTGCVQIVIGMGWGMNSTKDQHQMPC